MLSTAFNTLAKAKLVYNKQKVSVAYLSAGYLDKKKVNTYTDNTIVDNLNNFNYSNSGFHFSDQFTDNTSEWFEGSDDKKDFKIKNGKYYLKHKRTEKGWATYDDHYIDTSKDFEIETKLDKISGVSNYGYGLIFGKKGDNDYRFYISSSGYYKVARMLNDKEQVIQKWTSTTYVNTGNLKSNILKIKKEDGLSLLDKKLSNEKNELLKRLSALLLIFPNIAITSCHLFRHYP